MPTKVYCQTCKQQVGLIRIIDYGNCQPPTYLQKLAIDGEIILRKNPKSSDALYACSACKTGFPEYGTFENWWNALHDKELLKKIIKREKRLVRKSYAEEILQSTGKV